MMSTNNDSWQLLCLHSVPVGRASAVGCRLSSVLQRANELAFAEHFARAVRSIVLSYQEHSAFFKALSA